MIRLLLGLALVCCAGCEGLRDGDGDGFVDALDCEPDDPDANPSIDVDPYGDGVDQNCDGADGIDRDGDGYPTNVPDQHERKDCDDGDTRIHPGAEEFVGDLLDTDCDGSDD